MLAALTGATVVTPARSLGVILLLLFQIGCAESNFRLSEGSRLPKWCASKRDVSEARNTVRISYYVRAEGRDAVVKCNGHLSWFSGDRFVVKLKGLEPHRLGASLDRYPNYEIGSANGILDVFEHREMGGDIFMVDDQSILHKLGVIEH